MLPNYLPFLLLLLPLTLATNTTTTCYTDARAVPYTADVITLLAGLYEKADSTPDYPWEVEIGDVKIRVNGDKRIKKARAGDEAIEFIVNGGCLKNGTIGGLVDMGSHRVRISAVGK